MHAYGLELEIFRAADAYDGLCIALVKAASIALFM